jgi:hypothetical protein
LIEGLSRHRLTRLDWRPVASLVLALAIVTHGWHLSIEDPIAAIARELRTNVPALHGRAAIGSDDLINYPRVPPVASAERD